MYQNQTAISSKVKGAELFGLILFQSAESSLMFLVSYRVEIHVYVLVAVALVKARVS